MYRNRILSGIILQKHRHFKVDCVRPTVNNLSLNYKNSKAQSTVAADNSYVKKFMKAVGWMDINRTRLKLTGFFLYTSVPEKVAYQEWFEKLNLPDTFVSWFTVTELHVWLLMVRYMAEDVMTSSDKTKYDKGDGHFVRNCIIEALWADVANRIKLLEGANPCIAKKQVSELSEQFQAALVAYDEGLSDDRILASAVWRRIFALSEDADPQDVESVVHFIRHQISELDKIPSEALKWKPDIVWLSLLKH